jgi:hypothetical protein
MVSGGYIKILNDEINATEYTILASIAAATCKGADNPQHVLRLASEWVQYEGMREKISYLANIIGSSIGLSAIYAALSTDGMVLSKLFMREMKHAEQIQQEYKKWE